MRKTSICILIVFAFLSIIGCSATINADFKKGFHSWFTTYRVGPGDILEISIWKDEALTKQVVVRPDGGISFPLVGDINVADKTVEEIKKKLVKKLDEYIPSPIVTVSVIGINSYRIYVIGKVARPGEFTPPTYINVMQALSMAGGLTPFADEDDIVILRVERGKQVKIPFDYDEVAKGEKLEQNIVLKRGDVVIVP